MRIPNTFNFGLPPELLDSIAPVSRRWDGAMAPCPLWLQVAESRLF
jgi:hypothetical protein